MGSTPVTYIQVVLAFIEQQGCVLLTRRPVGRHLAGYWEFPGGKVAAGESFTAALQREIAEEIGVTIAVHNELATTRYRYTDRDVALHLFRCEVLHGTAQTLEVAEIRWVPIALLRRQHFPPANAALIDQLAQHFLAIDTTT